MSKRTYIIGPRKPYATIKRGKVYLDIGSKQDRYIHMFKIPHTHIHWNANGEKIYKRWHTKKKWVK